MPIPINNGDDCSDRRFDDHRGGSLARDAFNGLSRRRIRPVGPNAVTVTFPNASERCHQLTRISCYQWLFVSELSATASPPECRRPARLRAAVRRKFCADLYCSWRFRHRVDRDRIAWRVLAFLPIDQFHALRVFRFQPGFNRSTPLRRVGNQRTHRMSHRSRSTQTDLSSSRDAEPGPIGGQRISQQCDDNPEQGAEPQSPREHHLQVHTITCGDRRAASR